MGVNVPSQDDLGAGIADAGFAIHVLCIQVMGGLIDKRKLALQAQVPAIRKLDFRCKLQKCDVPIGLGRGR